MALSEVTASDANVVVPITPINGTDIDVDRFIAFNLLGLFVRGAQPVKTIPLLISPTAWASRVLCSSWRGSCGHYYSI